MQGLIVAVVVVWSAVYAVWVLMPATARRALARRLLKLPLPARLATRIQRAARAGGGCGGGCCDTPVVKPVTIHRR